MSSVIPFFMVRTESFCTMTFVATGEFPSSIQLDKITKLPEPGGVQKGKLDSIEILLELPIVLETYTLSLDSFTLTPSPPFSATSSNGTDTAPSTTVSPVARTTPVAVAVNTVTNRIYVANFDDDTISVINGATNTNLPSITIPSGIGNVNAGPTDVAVDSGNNRILVSVRATGLTVVDGAVSVPLLEVALNGGEGVGVNESSDKVYVSSTMGSSNNVSVLSNFPFCTPPGSGNFVILSSCILEGNLPVPENVMVENSSVLTIKNGMILDINFASFNLTVKSGSGVLIEAGGSIT